MVALTKSLNAPLFMQGVGQEPMFIKVLLLGVCKAYVSFNMGMEKIIPFFVKMFEPRSKEKQ